MTLLLACIMIFHDVNFVCEMLRDKRERHVRLQVKVWKMEIRNYAAEAARLNPLFSYSESRQHR